MKKAEREHYAKLAELGCVVCINKGHGYSQAEIHHLRTGAGMGQKSSYENAIPLCPQHHRTGGYGVAIHQGQGRFHELYGTELDLLELTKQFLSESDFI